ncbi:MAG TPA: GAF domain-containing protein, partial [Polyangiaceae bacterium]|nr:GAF domain-containing protein [Polyangiaceae bacterium]
MTSLPDWQSRVTSSAPHAHADELPHLVQFYGSDRELTETVTEFLEEGLKAGVPALVIATTEHWAAFRQSLLTRGIDVDGELGAGRIVAVDAQAMLGEILVNDSPHWEKFVAKLEPLIEHALASAENSVDHLRAYGELVDILWRDGKHLAALVIEDMWNELGRKHRFSLYCAYGLGGFYKQAGGIEAVRERHSGVRGRLEESLLAEEMRSLSAEVAQRKAVERDLRQTIAELALQKEALHRAETELRDFVDNAVLPLDVVDPEGRITWANRAQLEMLGYSAEEYVGKLAADFHADFGEGAEMSARLRRAHVLNSFPACLRAKDGSLRFVETSSSVYRRDGAVLYSRRFNRDVTTQRSAQRAQAQQETRAERLKRITAVIADAVTTDEVFEALVDRSAEVLEASASALWLIDETRKLARLAKSRGYAEPLAPALACVAIDTSTPVGRVLVDREPLWFDSPPRRGESAESGETSGAGNVSVALLPLCTQGKVLGALSMTFADRRPLDAAERNLLLLVARSSSQALERWRLLSSERENRRRAELLYGLAAAVMDAEAIEHIFEAALDAIESALGADRASILLFDPDEVVRFKAWRNLSSEYRAAVEGHCPWPRDARSPQPIVSGDVESDPAMAAYLELFRREGIGAIGFIPLVSGGRLIGKFMVYYTRPRELAASELHLARAIANQVAAAVVRFNSISELQRSVRFNEIFSGILGHDLRNPLNAIMMAAQTALLRDDPDLHRRSFSKIVASGSRMARMIEQLLDFTRVRLGGGIPLVAREADLLLIVRHAVEELEAAHPTHEIRLSHGHDTRGMWDTDRLAQVFSNLLGNAVQHGETGAGIDVVIDGRDVEFVTITVQNRGSIPAELLKDVFEPLCGGEPRAGSRGLGLGLFITRELVRAHGGDIRVRSEPTEGTTTFAVA